MYKQLFEIIGELAINRGDSVMVASDIVKFWAEYRKMYKDFSLVALIGLLQEKVGQEGTLIFPTYSWDFCHGKGFDSHRTAPFTGALGKQALKMEGFRRTQHPIYSFAVWGKDRDLLCAMQNKSAFGPDSPFAYLHHHAKNLIIGVIFNHCFTFAHYVEECCRVPYRYLKDFTDRYVDENGVESQRTYSMLVRDLDLNVVNVPLIDDFMNSRALRQHLVYYGVDFKLVLFEEAYALIEEDILYNRARNFVSYTGQEDETGENNNGSDRG